MNNEKQSAFKTALITGALRDLAGMRGGTGELRKPLSSKERAKRNKRNKQAKMSRKANRKGA